MKCPNCGVYLEDDRDTCFLCGSKVDGSSNEMLEFSNNTQTNNEFNINNDYLKEKEAYQNRFNDYKKINLNDLDNDKQDIFDFFAKHKKTIKIFFLSVLIIGIIVGLIMYFNSKNNSKKIKPLINQLYYELDDSFSLATDNTSQKKYVKTINGSQCIISIDSIKDSSETHSTIFFTDMKKTIAPRKDKDGKIIDPLEEYQEKSGKRTINGIVWPFLNIFYRTEAEGEFNVLRYKYLSSTYKDYSYDIVLINEKNNETCNIELDNFIKTLKYIEKE